MIFILIIIYVTFISLGLPDSLFGVAWPLMHLDMGLNESLGSLFTIIVGIGGGISSLISGPLVRKISIGYITAFSVLATAIGLLGFSFSTNIVGLIIFSLFLGFGAGAVDSVLNNFVSLHYKALHMNFLHCFWGVGVTLSPLIMSLSLAGGQWRNGYRTVAIIQFIITAFLFITIPLWKKVTDKNKDNVLQEQTEIEEKPSQLSPIGIIRKKGVVLAILSFGLYCAMEFIVGTWGASYLVNSCELTASAASKWISTFYFGIMAGRFLSGLLSLKLNDKTLIRSGIIFSMVGILILTLPLGNFSYFGFFLIGMGFGPIFPCSLHATSQRFGKEYSQDITGYQMGLGYGLAWFTQISFGAIASKTTFSFMPYLFIVINILLFVVVELINRKTKKDIKE